MKSLLIFLVILMVQSISKKKSSQTTTFTSSYSSSSDGDGNYSAVYYSSDGTNKCYKSGCFAEICSAMQVESYPCTWKAEYECYKHSECKFSDDRGCGWEHSDNFYKCMKNVSH